jgi:Putative peptidoglycan binding domain
MKKLTSLLIGCSLALAGAALAQQPTEQQSPSKGKHPQEKTHAAEAKPGANAAKPETPAAKQHGAMKEYPATNQPGAMKEHGATHEHGAGKGPKTPAAQESATGAQTGTNVSGQPGGSPTTEPGAGKGRKGRSKSENAAQPGTNVPGQPAASATPGAEQLRKGMKGRAAKAATPAAPAGAAASAAPSVSTGAQTTAPTGAAATTRKVEPQKVQQVKAQAPQIKQQHATFRAQPKPDQVPAVTFQQNYRIQGADQWRGAQYDVFRSYHPEWHDSGWYRSRYPRVELIGGGYYYWNNGYWYPAWGYDTSAQYYAYDAPIYVGHSAEPPDKVIADVQAELQQMGYYQGEVDGLLGPLTREALTAYQTDQGLTATAVIDEPTLNSLGLA